jgi:hypothetical protein
VGLEACDAALLDLRQFMQDYPALALKTDYTEAQSVGARIHREGHPGLVVPSVVAQNKVANWLIKLLTMKRFVE